MGLGWRNEATIRNNDCHSISGVQVMPIYVGRNPETWRVIVSINGKKKERVVVGSRADAELLHQEMTPVRTREQRFDFSAEHGCRIMLTRNQWAKVDEDDLERLIKYRWMAIWHTRVSSFTAVRNSPRVNGERQSHVYMHREIMAAPPGFVVDHKNHDTLDNRKENLRVCSATENSWNTRTRCDSRLGLKGVHLSGNGKIVAEIQANGKRRHLGRFHSISEAALAYNAAALDLFGQFAVLNSREAIELAAINFNGAT